MDNISILMNMKEQIEEAQKQKSKLEGSIETLMLKLKNDFGYSSVEEAIEGLEKMEKQCANRETRLFKSIEGLQEKFDGTI